MDVDRDTAQPAAGTAGTAGAGDDAATPHHVHRGWRKVQHHARARRSTHLLLKAVVLTLGLGLVVAGVVMLVVPGPGWAAIFLGLVVLASEFAWAERSLAPLRRFVDHWVERLRERHPVVLKIITAAGFLAVVAGLVAAVWWVLR